MSGPDYHGRTHKPGGTDPIEGLGGIDWNKVNSSDADGNDAAWISLQQEADSTFDSSTSTGQKVAWEFIATGKGGIEWVVDSSGTFVFDNFGDTSNQINADNGGDTDSPNGKASHRIKNTSDGDVEIIQDGGGRVLIRSSSDGDIEISNFGGRVYIRGDSGIVLHNLPTSDPGNTDEVWSDSLTLKVSA